jgi:MFS family permease
MMLVGAAGEGVSLLIVALGPSVPVMALVAFLTGILSANTMVAYISLRTQLSPDALLGRVGATARTLSVGLMPIGSLVAGIALDAIGGQATLAAMGGLILVVVVVFGLMPDVRRARLTGHSTPA